MNMTLTSRKRRPQVEQIGGLGVMKIQKMQHKWKNKVETQEQMNKEEIANTT